MKMSRVSMLAAAFLAMGSVVYAQETEMPESGMAAVETELAAETEAAAEAGTAAEAEAVLSDDWKDYQIQIEDHVYQFPMMYSDFTALGWSESDAEDADVELDPNQYTMVRFTRDDAEVTAYVVNLGMNTLPASECVVGGMDIDTFYWELDAASVTLPGGIVRGEADEAAIEAAYGTPSDTYEGDLYYQLTYETDYNSSVEMQVYKESGVLESIDIRNFVEPEGFDAGEASEEVPAAVLAYTKPDALGTDLSEYQIELDGQVYSMPVPVSVLISDGWELDADDSDETISAGNSGWVTLRKGGQEIRKMACNAESYATIPANCWIEELNVGEYQTNVEGKLPGDIVTGMPEEEFLAVLDGADVAYEVEESGDYRYYSYSNPEYGRGYEVIVYAGEEGYFEKDTIMEISCSNMME